MTRSVVAVAFSRHGRLHYADPGTVQVTIGDQVLVRVAGIDRVGTVLWGPSLPLEEIGELPAVVRQASAADVAAAAEGSAKAERARLVARRLIRGRKLPMRVLGAEWVDVDQRVTVFFTAPHRVDFRDLIRALHAELSMRVLLRQVNERERAKLVGGVGVCGRDLCCSTFLDTFEPVTLQMARDQHLGTDPLRIAGACGRLMCCLRYEHPLYAQYTGRPVSAGGCAQASTCSTRAAHEARPGPRR